MTHLLQEQMAYYRARAQEYDEWFYRHGRYNRGEEDNTDWFAEVEAVRNALHQPERVKSALELASGTGIWTTELLKQATHITLVDASEEMHHVNRSKHPNATNLDFQQADLFTWEPTTTYDLVFFGFWFSHVPIDRVDAFLQKVHRALKPDGRLFMVDSYYNRHLHGVHDTQPDLENHTHKRTLNDGREFEIVKIYYTTDQLAQVLHKNGFTPTVKHSPNIIYAEARKTEQ